MVELQFLPQSCISKRLLTLVEQIILGVHENRCCNHDMPQRLHTIDDIKGGKDVRLKLKEISLNGSGKEFMFAWRERDSLDNSSFGR